jgi:hypothetical protein
MSHSHLDTWTAVQRCISYLSPPAGRATATAQMPQSATGYDAELIGGPDAQRRCAEDPESRAGRTPSL